MKYNITHKNIVDFRKSFKKKRTNKNEIKIMKVY